jgi:hypothetical protein
MAEKKKVAKSVQIKITPTNEVKSERVYANFFAVNHGPHDFTFTFCDIKPPLTDQDAQKLARDGVLRAPIQAEISVPVGLVEEIIGAIKINYEVYKKTYAKDKT